MQGEAITTAAMRVRPCTVESVLASLMWHHDVLEVDSRCRPSAVKGGHAGKRTTTTAAAGVAVGELGLCDEGAMYARLQNAHTFHWA